MDAVISNDEKRILRFLTMTALDFVPPLDSRVDLVAYSRKLSRAAINLFYRVESVDAGHAAVYANQVESGVAFLSSIAVDRRFRGSGIARALLEQVIATCRERGFRTLELEVGHLNSSAIHLYQAFGFRTLEGSGEIRRMELAL